MTVLFSKERGTIQIEENDSVGNSITVSGPPYRSKDNLWVEIDNPWSGDTESGFGRTAHITLSYEDARELAAFLLDATKDK